MFFYSTGSNKSKGVIILLHKNLQFKCKTEKRNEECSIIVILAELQGRPHNLTNTYAPNSDDPNVFVPGAVSDVFAANSVPVQALNPLEDPHVSVG